MNETVAVEQAVPGVFARAIGIITSPKATFEQVVKAPRAIGILALTAILFTACASTMALTERGRAALIDFQTQNLDKAKAMGFPIPDASYDGLEQQVKYTPITTGIAMFVGLPIGLLIFSGVLYAVFNAIMGGTADFKQVMAVTAHVGIIGAVGNVFATAIHLARGYMTLSVANLGMLFPMLRENSFAANLLTFFDFFRVWSLIVLAIGLGVLYKRKTSSIATGFFIVLLIVGLAVSYFTSKG